MRINTLIRYLITLLLLALAIWLGKALWDHYMHSPWIATAACAPT